METRPRLNDDFSRGFAVGLQRQRRSAGALLRYTGLLLGAWLLMLLVGVIAAHDPEEIAAVATWSLAWAVTSFGTDPGLWPVDTSSGPERWPPSAFRADGWFRAHASAVGGTLWIGALVATAIVTLGGLLGHRTLKLLGQGMRSTRYVRGQQIIADRALARALQRQRLASEIHIGAVPMIRASETQHTVLIGTTGVGKTQVFLHFLDAIAARGDAAIIYDRSCGFVPLYHDGELGDVILNPLDARSPPWSPWAEMAHDADADRLAAALIPHGENREPFFTDAARTLLSALLTTLQRRGKPSLQELMRLVMLADTEEKRRVLRGSEAAKYFEEDGEKTLRSIESNMATYVRALRFLPAGSGGSDDFSIRRFIGRQVDGPVQGGRRPWLFLTSRPSEHDALRPLLSCWIDAAVAGLMAAGERRERRLWVMLDELDTLHALPKLPELLAEGRNYGGAAVAGLQSMQQLFLRYGDKGGKALLDTINTKAIFRLNDPDSARWAADAIGQAERDVMRESTRYDPSVSEATGIQLASQRLMQHVVMPSEIVTLDDLCCFVKLPGRWPVARTTLPDPAAGRRTARATSFEPVGTIATVEQVVTGAVATASVGRAAPKTPDPSLNGASDTVAAPVMAAARRAGGMKTARKREPG